MVTPAKRPRGKRVGRAMTSAKRGRPQLAAYGLLPDSLAKDVDAWALPRGSHGIEAETITAMQRARLLLGMVRAVAKNGYVKTRVADVIAEAGLSRKTFYQQFEDKEDCYVAAFAAGNREHVKVMVESQRPGSGWLERVNDSLDAYLNFFRDRPEATFALMVEVHAAGERAWALRDEVFARFARMQRNLFRIRQAEKPGLADVPEEVYAAIVAASDELVCRAVRQGRDVLTLKPAILYLLHALLEPPAPARAALRVALR